MKMTGLFYVCLCLIFTVYGQVVLKWQIMLEGDFPSTFPGKMGFLFKALLNPWIFSSFASAFVAALAWMAAMTQMELSAAYPIMSLAIVVVMFLSVWLLGEDLSWAKAMGSLMVVGGLIILTR
jgi:multidrug transporter EmrE-like cation transporter